MKWFHAIGICGKTTSNVALMFKRLGWFVTGSDTQYFPPASDLLKKNLIPTVEGYSYKHLTKQFWMDHLSNIGNYDLFKEKIENISLYPDLCLIVESASNKNKEYLFAKSKGIKVLPFSQILSEYLIKDESVVVVGSAGKTTTTSLIVFALQKLKLDPSYMIGGECINIQDSLKLTHSNYSVVEGDEFYNEELAKGPKFMEYKPKYLVITNIGWEHQDIYPTRESYLHVFQHLVSIVDKNGFIVALENKTIKNVLVKAKVPVFFYSLKKKQSNYFVRVKKDNKGLISLVFNDLEDEISFEVSSFSLIGEYNYLNYLALYVLIKKLNIFGNRNNLVDFFKDVLAEFKGVRKRLEILKKDKNLIVIDDFGIAPSRIKNSIKTIKNFFTGYKIVVIFEPNSGSRIKNDTLLKNMYDKVFDGTKMIIIPTLSGNEDLLTGKDLSNFLNSMGYNSKYVETEFILNEVQNFLKGSKDKFVILVASSYRLTELAQNLAKLQ